MVVIDANDLKRHAKALSKIEGGFPKAVGRALNRTLKSGKTEVSKQVRSQYLIKKEDFDATIATPISGMTGEIRSRFSGMLLLYDFKVTPRRMDPRNPKLLTATVRKGGGGTLGRAFLGAMSSGHVGVFARTTDSRLPVQELRTISAPIMMSQAKVAEPAMEKMAEVFWRRMDHEAGRLLGGAA